MRKVQFSGKDCKGIVSEFEVIEHPEWMVLKTPEGTIIKVKMDVSELVRVVDEFYENGEPAYLVSWTISQSVIGAPGTQREDETPKKKVQ